MNITLEPRGEILYAKNPAEKQDFILSIAMFT